MPEKFSTSNSYTDAELLALSREGYAQILTTGRAYTISGRSWTAAELPQLQAAIEWLESRIGGDSAPATNLVKFTRR